MGLGSETRQQRVRLPSPHPTNCLSSSPDLVGFHGGDEGMKGGWLSGCHLCLCLRIITLISVWLCCLIWLFLFYSFSSLQQSYFSSHSLFFNPSLAEDTEEELKEIQNKAFSTRREGDDRKGLLSFLQTAY